MIEDFERKEKEIVAINSEPFLNEMDFWGLRVRMKVDGKELDHDTVFLSETKEGLEMIAVGKKWYGSYWGVMK